MHISSWVITSLGIMLTVIGILLIVMNVQNLLTKRRRLRVQKAQRIRTERITHLNQRYDAMEVPLKFNEEMLSMIKDQRVRQRSTSSDSETIGFDDFAARINRNALDEFNGRLDDIVSKLEPLETKFANHRQLLKSDYPRSVYSKTNEYNLDYAERRLQRIQQMWDVQIEIMILEQKATLLRKTLHQYKSPIDSDRIIESYLDRLKSIEDTYIKE